MVYDCVHGYIELTDQERKIIDTPVFQRLHNIKQLGTGYLVYPGATHTRFAHSLGTLATMEKLATRLEKIEIIDDEAVEKLRLAALLHDVGHYPFSHVLELPTKKLSSNGDGDHEQLSAYLIENSCLKDQLETYKPDEISSIITKKVVDKPFYSLLISSDLDVDRIDYLMRDAHSTGVSYGLIDLQRLIQTITFNEGHLAVEAKGRQALENFLMARYHMYQTIYYHKTVVCFDLMLQRIYEELIRNESAYDYDAICKLSEQDFYHFNDCYVWNLLQKNQNNSNLHGELISRILKRKPLKMIKQVRGLSFSGPPGSKYSRLSLIQTPVQLEMLSKQSEVPKEWIFYSLPNPLRILSNAEEEGAVHVLNKDKTSTPIAKDETSIISMLYNSCSLSARIYTKDEYKVPLLTGLQECFNLD